MPSWALFGSLGRLQEWPERSQDGLKKAQQPLTNKSVVRDRLLGLLEPFLIPFWVLLGDLGRLQESSQRTPRWSPEGPTTCQEQTNCSGKHISLNILKKQIWNNACFTRSYLYVSDKRLRNMIASCRSEEQIWNTVCSTRSNARRSQSGRKGIQNKFPPPFPRLSAFPSRMARHRAFEILYHTLTDKLLSELL